jgi:uncharacterized protein
MKFQYICIFEIMKANKTLKPLVTMPLVGRKTEYDSMRELLNSRESELLAVIGRRRVGKTFLIKHTYAAEMVFQITGIQDSKRNVQLKNFIEARNEYFPKADLKKDPKTWFEAFTQLKQLLKSAPKSKRVVFFDELPWLAECSTEFLPAFDHFWNSWAVNQRIIVVICGSAASWMIKNIINDTGGLHNRVTARVYLDPFTLKETEYYLAERGVKMPRMSIMNIYMATGGIPYYLREIKKNHTELTAIDHLYFGAKAPLKGEFDNLYKSLFQKSERHVSVIKALAKKWKGLTRSEIAYASGLSSGGTLTEVLQELETSYFISSSQPYGKKERDTIYRLTDEYSMFYIKFIEQNELTKNYWLQMKKDSMMTAWQGFAFETLCMKHVDGVKKGLGISGINSSNHSFVKKADAYSDGCQIDLLIERADNALHICEIKYRNSISTLTKIDVQKMQVRKQALNEMYGHKKQIFTTFITTLGLKLNTHAYEINNTITLNNLFDIDNF